MVYRVVKTINGSQYLYEQETYREGGRVRTKSRYIGRADGGVATRTKDTTGRVATAIAAPTKLEATTAPIDHAEQPQPPFTLRQPEAVYEVDPETGEVLSERPTPRPATRLNTTKLKPTKMLKIRAKVDRHSISRAALEAEHRHCVNRIEALGMETTDLPRVLVGNASTIQAKRRWFTGNYIVTLPRFPESAITKALKKPVDRRTTAGRTHPQEHTAPDKGVRTEFKREYRKALAHVMLDAMERQQPEAFDTLRTHMDEQYRFSKNAIARYIMNTNIRGRSALTLHYMMMGQLSGWLASHVDAEALGQPDHKMRSGWREDSAALMGEVFQRGFHDTWQRYKSQQSKARALERNAITQYQKAGMLDALSGKKRKLRREVQRATARAQATSATLGKLQALQPIVGEQSSPKRRPNTSPRE